ncbi:glycosyl hydrolase family 28-related protein [Bacillus xiapuensis]|uniref:glycosyl hydrolase family 28-related protein n=1 Tax=Bacillus xiapuensis TaxID=2014075 RepID=UPI000C248DB2|nr:glycosyl hydrolase family 28-related protein [Bacillus xiapuensis]
MRVTLTKEHNPQQNESWIESFFNQSASVREAVAQTRKLFQQTSPLFKRPDLQKPATSKLSVHLWGKIKSLLFGLFLPNEKSRAIADFDIVVDDKGRVAPDWEPILLKEYRLMRKQIIRTVNVLDYGAVGDGKTDCTEAFRRAIGKGKVQVIVPEGTYIVRGVRLPSWTWIIGEGKGQTTLKLHKDAPISSWVVTNKEHKKGNHHIIVQDMSLDWHVERLGEVEKTSAGGNRSSCLTYANVSFGWVQNVEAINPGLHGFDVSSTFYNYSGDGHRARGGSKFIRLDGLNGYGFGDDGITTHHSDYIWISNSHMCDPSGKAHKKGFSNSNGIEIDDGSRNVLLVNNSTARCFGGVEIKAHHNSSAATNVHIVGHLSVNDNRSFNFRHIGHHSQHDPESKTAYNITATRIVSIAPIRTDLYRDSTPRALVVSAYKNVVINHFQAIGDESYDYQGYPVVAVQYRSRNVSLEHIYMSGFRTAGTDIKIFGGPQRTDVVRLKHVQIQHSAPVAITIGPRIEQIFLYKVQAIATEGVCGCECASSGAELTHFFSEGYKQAFKSTENKIP